MFTHRISKDWTPAGVNSGFIQSSFSKDYGMTWDSVLLVQDQAKLCRYPSGTFFNPVGNTSTDSAFAAVTGPWHPGANWAGNYFASSQLDGTDNFAAFDDNTLPPGQDFVRIGMQQAGNKVVVTGGLYGNANGTTAVAQAYRGATINYGTFNGTNNFVWTVDSIKPNFMIDPNDGSFYTYTAAPTAWSKDGMIGYVVFFGVDAACGERAYQPLVWKTINGGTSWAQTPLTIFSAIPSINEKLTTTSDGTTKKAWYSQGSGVDAIVDSAGNLHIINVILSASSTSLDSLGYTWTRTDNISYIYDTYTTSTGWGATLLDSLKCKTSDDNSPLFDSNGPISVDARIQAGASPDRSHIFVLWMDSDPTQINGENAIPDIYGKAFNIGNQTLTPTVQFTNTSDNYFLYVSNEILVLNDSTYKIPCTASASRPGSGDTEDTFDHYFVSGVQFDEADFTTQYTVSSSVVVNSVPPAQPGVIAGVSSVCSLSTESYSVDSVLGATFYTWTLPLGWTGSSTSNSITSTPGSIGGTISVTATNSCGTSSAQTLTVVANSLAPAQLGFIAGDTTACSFSTESYSVDSVLGATSYTWTLPGGWSGMSVTNSITTIVGTAGGAISVVANNGCGFSNTQTLSIMVNISPLQPVSISGLDTVCSDSAQTYFISAVSGAFYYTWTLPSGWLGTSDTTSIAAIAGSGGNITVTANDSICSSPAQTLSVTVISSQLGTISGSSNVCDGSTQIYSVTPISGAGSYTWTLPSGWVGTSTTSSISVTAGTTAGSISVTATNICGTGSAQTSITVIPLPEVPVITASENILTSSATSGNQWSFNGTPIVGATAQFYTMTGNGSYTVTVTENGCSLTSAPYLKVDTGISESENEQLFIIFPNPTRGIVNITLKGNRNIEAAYICNVLGKTVKVIPSQHFKGTTSYSFDAKELVPGVYFFTLQTEGKRVTKKLVIQ